MLSTRRHSNLTVFLSRTAVHFRSLFVGLCAEVSSGVVRFGVKNFGIFTEFETCNLSKLSALVGPTRSGKTTLLIALRVFYSLGSSLWSQSHGTWNKQEICSPDRFKLPPSIALLELLPLTGWAELTAVIRPSEQSTDYTYTFGIRRYGYPSFSSSC
jgi:hypothetical protein